MATVVWEQQAQRLQDINASFLDAAPIVQPQSVGKGLKFHLPLSILPKVNNTIGSKNEKVPTSPIHTIPIFSLFYGQGSWSTEIWGGFLPTGAEKIMGLSSSVTEFLGGLKGSYSFVLSPDIKTELSLGLQYAQSDVEGGITEIKAKDSFKVRSTLFYTGFSFIYSNMYWASLSLGTKNTHSILDIPSDQAHLVTRDTLSDSNIPLYTTLMVGLTYNSWKVGIGEHYVPLRLWMPKAFVTYEYAL